MTIDLDALEKRLRDLRIVLKSGEYDGADLMRAWCAMIEAADMISELKEATAIMADVQRSTQGPSLDSRIRAFLARNGKGEG